MNKILLITILVASYFLIINGAYAIFPLNTSTSTQEQNLNGNGVKMDVGNSVSVSIKRPRFYGTIYEANGKSQLQFLTIIPIPLKIDKFNLIYIHIPFIILLLFIALRKPYKPKYPYYENEALD